MALAVVSATSACADKNDSADTAAQAQKAIEQERAMMAGMQKGIGNIEKKQNEATSQ